MKLQQSLEANKNITASSRGQILTLPSKSIVERTTNQQNVAGVLEKRTIQQAA